MFNSKKFSYSFDLSGTDRPTIISLPIATATVIERGEKVALSAGLVVASGGTATAIGFSADPHDGSSDGQKDTMIRVYASPTAVVECIPAKQLVADSGGANTIVDATVDGVADDVFNGGKVIAIDCDNIPAGTVLNITDFVGATGTFTISGGFTVVTADTFVLLPPVGSLVIGVDSDGTNLDLEAAGSSVMVVATDVKSEKVFVIAYKHQASGVMA